MVSDKTIRFSFDSADYEMDVSNLQIWDERREKWRGAQINVSPGRRFGKAVLRASVSALVAFATFVAGAISPIPKALIANSVVQPIGRALRVEPLVFSAELQTGCDVPDVPFGGLASVDPNVDPKSWVQEGPVQDPLPTLNAGVGVFGQATVHVSLRQRWDQPVVVENVSVTAQELPNLKIDWAALSFGGCGGGVSVGSRVYRVNLDKGSKVSPDYANSRGLTKKEAGPRFVVLPDAPTDMEVDVRSCKISRILSIYVDYTVQGLEYRHELAASLLMVSGRPQRRVVYDDHANASGFTSWTGGSMPQQCRWKFRRSDS